MLQRTAKSCGPDAPTLASSSRSCVGPTGLRQDLSVGDGGKQAWSPGRARRKPLKPLRAGMPGDSGVLVVTRVRSTTTKCTRGRGCNGHPAFPTPSQGRKIHQRLGRIAPRDREGAPDDKLRDTHHVQERWVSRKGSVAVGTPITERPPHRTVRARFGHTAPTLGV